MEQAEGVNTNKCHCKTCDLVVLLARKGRVVANTELRVPREGGDALALEWETPAELLCVATQFDFENVCYSRNHKNLPGGQRILTCAGCERGVLGVALPQGEGPDIRMTSYLLPSRVSWQ